MVVTVGEKLGEGVDGVLLVGGRLKAERLHNECLIVYSVHFGFLLKACCYVYFKAAVLWTLK